jgi:3-hydroxyisobutyrate dehydrogenase-like beta-hydroxyacid dehydrogenase
MTAIGFIGFGEAGFSLAMGLGDAGAGRLFSYDINTPAAFEGQALKSYREVLRAIADSATPQDSLRRGGI